MSASAINAVPQPATNPAQGTGGTAPIGQGAPAGFEALLAVFLGADEADLTPGPAAGAATLAASKTLVGVASDSLGSDPNTANGADDAASADLTPDIQIAAAVTPLPALAPPPIAEPPPAAGDQAVAAAPPTFDLRAAPEPAQPTGEPAVADGASKDAAPAALQAAVDATARAALASSARRQSLAPDPGAPPSTPPTSPPDLPQPSRSASPALELQAATPPVSQVATVAQSLIAPQIVGDGRPAAPPSANAPKDRSQAGKSTRVDVGRIDIATAPTAKTNAVAPAIADPALNLAAGESGAAGLPDDAKAETGDTPAANVDASPATAATTNPSTLVHAGVLPVRGAPETVALLAAQIAKKLDSRSSRFDLQLDPVGLGRVDVRLEIGASGRVSAALTFDTPAAAAELRARASELQRHLEQAGFDVSGGLSFDVAGDRGQGRQAPQHQDQESGQAFRGRAFQQALATAGDAAQSAASGALNLRRSLRSGVDIRI